MGIGRESRTILRFAATGVVIAILVGGVLFAYLKTDPPDNWIRTGAVLVAVVLCPGFIPFAWAAAIEMGIPSRLIIWLAVIAINFVLYSGIGAVYVKLRSWREGTSTTY